MKGGEIKYQLIIHKMRNKLQNNMNLIKKI